MKGEFRRWALCLNPPPPPPPPKKKNKNKIIIIIKTKNKERKRVKARKIYITDGAYFCYCAYVLRISRYSGFLWVVATNTKCSWYPNRKLGVTMHFSEIIKLQFRKKSHTLLYILALFRNIVA